MAKNISRLETLLKVIITPVVRGLLTLLRVALMRGVYIFDQDPTEAFVLNYILLIGDSSFSNFQKVCLLGRPSSLPILI